MMNDTTAVNVNRFESVAASWDESPTRTALAQSVARAILERIPANARRNLAMEFGAGTGLVTALVAPTFDRVMAVDSSAKMLDVLRSKQKSLGLNNVETLELDATAALPEGPFDLIFSSMTMHHIDDIPALFANLCERLAIGGWLAVADLESEDGSFHADPQGIRHHGFEPGTIRDWLISAGFNEVKVETIHEVRKETSSGEIRAYPVFLATGKKTGA